MTNGTCTMCQNGVEAVALLEQAAEQLRKGPDARLALRIERFIRRTQRARS